jgi:hypothetical protein
MQEIDSTVFNIKFKQVILLRNVPMPGAYIKPYKHTLCVQC